MKFQLIILAALIIIGTGYAEEYSVVAGDWRVTFDTNTPVSTNVMWSESSGMKNGGFFSIWANTSYQVSGIALLELEIGSQSPTTRDYLEGYLQSIASTKLSKSDIGDYKIDGKNGLVAHQWNDKLRSMAYMAVFPADPTLDDTATTFVEYLSFIGETPSMEIINSIHVVDLGARANSSASNYLPRQPVPTTTRQATGTRDDPIPLGTTVDLGDGWQIAVMSVIPDATNFVHQENQFNNPPKAGDQFFLARVQAKYTGAGSATFGGSYRLRAVGPSSVGYSTFANSPGVIPDPLPDSEVFSGGVIEGNIGWEIKASDAGSLVMYDNPISFGDGKSRVYMALYGGPIGSSSPSTFSNEQGWATKGSGKMGRY